MAGGRTKVATVAAVMALALLAASCSTGVIDVPASSAPLRDPGGGADIFTADAGTQEESLALVTVHNAAPGAARVLGVSVRTIGSLVFDGASLESLPDNNPGEGVTRTPFPKVPGESLAPITRLHHPLVRSGADENLIVRVHLRPEMAGGATLSTSLRYRTGGRVYHTVYVMTYVQCAGSFDGFAGTVCNQLHDRARAFAASHVNHA
jgi:hypothetical protein